MSGFGGAVKLTGESEYRKALNQITQSLKEVSSEMKAVSASYSSNDKSVQAVNAKTAALNKVLTEQTNKLNALKSQYAAMSSQYQQQAQKHQQLIDAYNKEKAELDKLGQTVGTTSKEYQTQKAKVEEMAQAVKQSTTAQDANEKSMSNMRIAINNAQADCNKTAKAIDDLGKETEETSKQVDDASEGFTVFKGVLANLASQAITAAINGLKKLGESLVSVGKQAYSSYASYEQLVGGVETLFGESADQLIEYAQQAYKTAGVSANEYMEQATSFSATLLQGLGGDTKKAVQYADLAIRDMSDNANKMGTDMYMIQNAYQGFAKDNYTMLDNLKLGYGGTAGEMARLINDTGVLGQNVEVTAKTVKDVPFDKIIEAIHKTQQEIGITGTTTLEAEKTIEGSTKAMKAAWQNLLVGIADEKQDISPLLDNLTDQVLAAGKNMIPRVKEIIKGIGQLVSEVWNEVIPELAKEFPQLQPIVDAMNWIKNNAKYIISALSGILAGFVAFKAVTFITSIVTAVSSLFSVIQAGIPIMKALNLVLNANPVGLIVTGIAALVTAFTVLWNTSDEFRNFWINLWENIKETFSNVWNAITGFFTTTIPEAFNSVRDKILEWKDNVVAFFKEIPVKVSEMIDNVITFLKELPYNLGVIVGEALGHIIKFGIDAAEWVRTKVPEIIDSIVTFFKELPSKIWNWLVNTYNKISEWGKNVISKAKETGKNFIDSTISFFKELPSRVWTWLLNTISKVKEFSVNIAQKAKEGAKNLFDNVVNGIKELPAKVKSIGADIVKGLWNGITGMKDWVMDKIKSFGKGILDGMKKVLGIQSPSKVFRDEVGKYLAEGIGVGFTDEMKNVSRQMQDSIPTSFDTEANISGVNGSLSAARTFYDVVAAFKEALSEMKIELDDEVAGKFVERTVTRVVYQ